VRSTVPARVRALPSGPGRRQFLALDCTGVGDLAERARSLREAREEEEEEKKTEEEGEEEMPQGSLGCLPVLPDFLRQPVSSRFTKPENLATKELYPRQFERWTLEEKEYLRQSWGRVPPLEMLSVLQRSWRSVGIYWDRPRRATVKNLKNK